MNEGWATFTHYYIMNRLYDKGLLTDGAMLEFMKLHTGVVYQPSFSSKFYSGINPYYLGFKMFLDIKRICEEPTEEDKEWFPDIAGKPWLPVCLDAVENYRDESFVRQFLSPKLMRDMKLFVLNDDKSDEDYFHITDIHDLTGYRKIRNALAQTYEISDYIPRIEITKADIKYTRRLSLTYYMHKDRALDDSLDIMLDHIKSLWGHPVEIRTQNGTLLGELD